MIDESDMKIRTSVTHPLRIDELRIENLAGVIHLLPREDPEEWMDRRLATFSRLRSFCH
jgi:hypothetical protein